MQRIDAEELESFVRALVAGLDAEESVARDVARSLVEADLVGHGSHGSIRMGTLYREMVEADDIKPRATPETERLGPTAATVDGNCQYGQIVGRRAVDVGTALAEESGVGVVGVRNAAHLGRIGEWAERAAEVGVCFAAFVNTGGTAPLVAAPGSADRLLSTNPIAFGIPSFGALPHSIVLDIATSQVAHGKVTKRAVENRPLPENWVVDEEGKTVTDSQEYEDGTGVLMPLGGLTSGYKGFGLAMMADLFAGIIGDHRVSGQGNDRRVDNGAMFCFIDPTLFSTLEANRERVAVLAERVRGAGSPEAVTMGPTAKGERAMVPGEPEYETKRKRLDEGIPFREETITLLADVARRVGAESSIPASFSD